MKGFCMTSGRGCKQNPIFSPLSKEERHTAVVMYVCFSWISSWTLNVTSTLSCQARRETVAEVTHVNRNALRASSFYGGVTQHKMTNLTREQASTI